jgi:hypothetical protein
MTEMTKTSESAFLYLATTEFILLLKFIFVQNNEY